MRIDLFDNPGKLSAHTLARLDRHEIASVSELLPSQLLQLLNVNPLEPKLAFLDISTPELGGPVEPTQVAGFNQLFDDANGARAERDTIAILKTATVDLQLEASHRRLSLPVLADNVLASTEFQQGKAVRLSAG